MKKTMGLMGILLFMTCPQALLASASITLQWNPNTECDIVGYRLFKSEHSMLGMTAAQALVDSSVTTRLVTPGTVTEVLVTGLTARTKYYFRLTAVDNGNNESDFNLDSAGKEAEVVVFLPDENEAKATQKFLSPTLVDGKNDAATFGMQAVEVTIYDLQGHKIFHATESGIPLIWGGKDDNGMPVRSGIYIAKIRQKDGKLVYQTFTVSK